MGELDTPFIPEACRMRQFIIYLETLYAILSIVHLSIGDLGGKQFSCDVFFSLLSVLHLSSRGPVLIIFIYILLILFVFSHRSLAGILGPTLL